jgi:D-alanyl-lipoteichoic acid acyltransferase DltB (MBOAT superfamily)
MRAAGVLAVVTVATFLAGRRIGDLESKHRAHTVFLCAIVLLVSYLFFFKIAAVAPMGRFSRITLPLGVSYYTFKLLSYVLDVYWGALEPAGDLISFAAAIAFFPQIVAGPIHRPGDFLKQLPPSRTSLSRGTMRLVWGLAKKVWVADKLAPAVGYVFAHVRGLHGVGLLAGIYLLPLQMYADFSALTDIANGMGLLFGIEGPENFNRPFTAQSPSGFWRCWHMSLTHWLADYVFMPLRMATRALGNAGLAFSITINMMAIALWHGLTLGFVIFGLANAAYLVVDTLTVRHRARFYKAYPKLEPWGSRGGWLLTFHLIATAMVLFKCHTLSDAGWLLAHAWTGFTGLGFREFVSAVDARSLRFGLLGYGLLEIAERFRPDQWWAQTEPRVPLWVQQSVRAAVLLVAAIALFVLTVQAGGHQTPFLYQVF